jgi:ATP-dependent exoDNAse (exonuclease V) beta subunit
MIGTAVSDSEEKVDTEEAPHISNSRLQKYLTCPEQYRLHYIERLQARTEPASLVFGSVLHLALAGFSRHKHDAAAIFEREWQALRELELRYSKKETWDFLRTTGTALLEEFRRGHAQRIARVLAVEEPFGLTLSNLHLPFVIDLVAEMAGKLILIDWKTAGSDFEEFEVELLDQLTAYQLARPEVEQTAVCVFLKQKKPRIVWHLTRREPSHVVEYLHKAEAVTDQIARGVFYKRFGRRCRQREFLPLCLGDQAKAEKTLVKTV